MFAENLIESGGTQSRRDRWGALGGVAFQLSVLAGLTIFPLYQTEMLPPRGSVTMLYAPPSGVTRSLGSIQAPRPAPAPAVVPSPVPSPLVKPRPAPVAHVEAGNAVLGGMPGGLGGAAPTAVLHDLLSSTHTTPPAPPAAPASQSRRIRVAARVAEGNLIHDVTPVYPAEAGRARLAGSVTLVAVIATDGSVKDVRVVSGPPLLAQAAVEAVRQWRYRPYMVEGVPVEVDAPILINFAVSGA